MNRQEKELVVKTLRKYLTSSKTLFFIGYKGLSVGQMQTLRGQLREKGVQLKVAKARLVKRAIEEAEGINQLEPFCKDQIALVFTESEPSVVAKVLNDFSKKHEVLRLIVGYLDSQLFDEQAIKRIALLPSKKVLLAQLVGTMKAPLSSLVRDLNMLIIRLVWVLKQIAEKK